MAEHPVEESTKKRSCLQTGCIVAMVLLILMVVWIASSFVVWSRCRIPLPDGSGSVIYMSRLHKILCAEWDRKVRIDTKRIHAVSARLPDDTCGAWPVNVYWYPPAAGRGAYLRFRDPLNEYLVDLKHGKTLFVVREHGRAYVGDISDDGFKSWEASGPVFSVDGKVIDNTVQVTVNDRPARRLETSVASSPGQYLGRIEHPRRPFVSSKEAPETVLPKH